MDNPSIDISSEEVLTQPDTSIANKLDRLLEVVKGMDGKLKESSPAETGGTCQFE